MIIPPNSIIVSGPVIIEEGKVLLNKEKKESGITPWLFPGGTVESFDISLQDTCKREVKEEMGIDIEILAPLMPILHTDNGRLVILIHFLAQRIGEVTPGENIVEWAWHDIKDLPPDCAPNVSEVINDIVHGPKLQ